MGRLITEQRCTKVDLVYFSVWYSSTYRIVPQNSLNKHNGRQPTFRTPTIWYDPCSTYQTTSSSSANCSVSTRELCSPHHFCYHSVKQMQRSFTTTITTWRQTTRWTLARIQWIYSKAYPTSVKSPLYHQKRRHLLVFQHYITKQCNRLNDPVNQTASLTI
jgi:hypothetical protein